MARAKIAESVQSKLLVDCRRRCCLCFGLNRDTAIKSGQIAHIDRDPKNSDINNLAFLCFDHHNEYDSRTSQSKGITKNEVLSFRDELISIIKTTFSQKVHFGEIATPPMDPYAGTYIRIGSGSDSAEISLAPLPDDPEGNLQYFLYGMSLFGAERPSGPNIGFLNNIGSMSEGGIFALENLHNLNLDVRIVFLDDRNIKVLDNSSVGWHGFGVTFSGLYSRS